MIEREAKMPQVLEYGRPERSRIRKTLNEVGFTVALGLIAIGLGVLGTVALGWTSDALGLNPWTTFAPAYALTGITFLLLAAYVIGRDRQLTRAIMYWIIYLSALALFAWMYSLLPPWF